MAKTFKDSYENLERNRQRRYETRQKRNAKHKNHSRKAGKAKAIAQSLNEYVY